MEPWALSISMPTFHAPTESTKAVIFATHAGLALGAAETLEGATDSLNSAVLRLENLNAALVTREVIGQAQGILIERERITADQAFSVLRVASQHLNVKLREVARYVVETGEVPD
jgi:hypothetical protein